MASMKTREYFIGLPVQPEREVVHLVDDPAVDVEEAVGLDPSPAVVDLGDDGPDRDEVVRRQDLAPIGPSVEVADPDRLEPGPGARPPTPRRYHFKQLLEGFQTQRTRADRVL